MGVSTLAIAGLAAAAGVVAGYALPRADAQEYDSVAFLADALDERGVKCGGELRVHTSRGIKGEIDPFENGWCPRFDGYDQGDFFTFDDAASREQYLAELRERTGTSGPGVSGVMGSNWIVSVPLEETARRVQEAIGGEVVGF